MAYEFQHLHFVLLPLMAPGHIIPMIDMAKLLSKRSLHVTIIVTNLDAARFHSTIDRAVASGLSINLLKVEFPCAAAGLPPGCESADLLPSYTLLPNFFTAINMLQKPVEHMLTHLTPAPSCIIYDKHIIWTVETCDSFQIPRLVFDGMSCFTQVLTHHLHTSNIHASISDQNQPFLIPNLPHEIEMTKSQLPGLFNPPPNDVKGYREKVRETEVLAYGMIVNTFEEMEDRYVEEFRNLKRGKIWCVGPLSLCSGDRGNTTNNNNNTTPFDADSCMRWLDGRNPNSVVYACLGSLSRLSSSQFMELALGLEESGHPFLLVVKGGDEKIERWIMENGIEERCRERGLLVRGWAPQVAILSHPSVGGFLTHCGWNSTLEGISAGIPMMTWPFFADQFFNEKLVVQVLEVGVGVGARRVVHFGEEEKVEEQENVRREGVAEAVRRVMDEGREGGCERKERARELGEMARRSVEEAGSSYVDVTRLIEDISNLVKKKKMNEFSR